MRTSQRVWELIIAKSLKRLLRHYSAASRRALHDHSPLWARRLLGPAASYFDLLIMDHGLFRLLYLNKHKLGDKAWRSAQPAPHDIARLKEQGIKTVINLRGANISGGYGLEVAACKHHGIVLANCVLRSRAAPSVEELHAARDLLMRVRYPVLIHCKSGADRAGLMSVLYMHLIEGQPIEEAIKQLSLKFGHIRQADTGVLDRFFEEYIAANTREPIDFFDWVENVYDAQSVLQSFRSNGLATRIVKDILRRE